MEHTTVGRNIWISVAKFPYGSGALGYHEAMIRALALTAVALANLIAADVDRDGIYDALEQSLIEKFAPTFYMHASDCDSSPAEFTPGNPQPKVANRNGALYAQVLRSGDALEVHYYHLWGKDCGRRMRHDLDAESVSVVLRKAGETYEAMYWYAAAHENTLCDMSHAIRATTPEKGETVWISKDKHASFLSRELCAQGCGNDDCSGTKKLNPAIILNLGEPDAPMNGATWITSSAWPLRTKMRPDFTPELLARMPQDRSVQLLPAREPAKGMRTTIKVAGTTYGALETANGHANRSVTDSLGRAVSSTGKALRRSVGWIRPTLRSLEF